jgi:hypothetical protein
MPKTKIEPTDEPDVKPDNKPATEPTENESKVKPDDKIKPNDKGNITGKEFTSMTDAVKKLKTIADLRDKLKDKISPIVSEEKILNEIKKDPMAYSSKIQQTLDAVNEIIANKEKFIKSQYAELINKELIDNGMKPIDSKELETYMIKDILKESGALFDSYQYSNKDEEFLFNEYFKLENKIKRFKK